MLSDRHGELAGGANRLGGRRRRQKRRDQGEDADGQLGAAGGEIEHGDFAFVLVLVFMLVGVGGGFRGTGHVRDVRRMRQAAMFGGVVVNMEVGMGGGDLGRADRAGLVGMPVHATPLHCQQAEAGGQSDRFPQAPHRLSIHSGRVGPMRRLSRMRRRANLAG